MVMLGTPLEIYLAAARYFPEIKASVDVTRVFLAPSNKPLKKGEVLNENLTSQSDVMLRIQLNLILKDGQPTLVIDQAVDQTLFSSELYELSESIKLDQLFQTSQVYYADVNRFGRIIPLSDWQKFRRVMYEKTSSKTCADLIIAHIRDSDKMDELEVLGLAPSQVESGCSSDDLECFNAVVEKSRSIAQKERHQIGESFKKNYPNIYKKLVAQKAAATVNAEKTQPDPYKDISKKLEEHVLGQMIAVNEVASLLASQQNKESSGVFLFVGPTGTGKTELAKAIAKVKKGKFIFFPMNQYTDSYHVSSFFGAATGYIGSTDKPILAKEIDNCQPTQLKSEGVSTEIYEVKNLVLLFDEFEKTHTKIQTSLLTVFDEKEYKGSYTKEGSNNVRYKYVFKDCCFVCTSNLFQSNILNSFQNGEDYRAIVNLFKRLNANTNNSFPPELLGRLSIIPFGPIPRGEIYKKLLRSKLLPFLDTMKKEFSLKEISVENESLILSILENKLYGEGVDIRRINLYFNEMKAAVYQKKGSLGDLSARKIILDCDNRNLVFKLQIYVSDMDTYHDLNQSIILP